MGERPPNQPGLLKPISAQNATLSLPEREVAAHDAPEFLARALPIYFIGDSHTLIHNHLLYRKNNTYYITQSHYVHGLYAQEVVVDGRLSERVMSPLVGLLAPKQTEAVGQLVNAADPNGWRLRWSDVTLVFQCGDLDARRTSMRLGADASLVLPFAPDEVVEGNHPVPYALVEREARQALAPLFDGLSKLREMGFERLAVACIPPPMHEEEWRRHQQPGPSEALRYAVVRTYNHVLASLAESAHIRFIDYWPLVTIDDKRDPRLDLDGVHLNLEAAAMLVDLVIQ